MVAAGINFADILARQGLYPDAPPLPLVVGYEVSGTVRAVGTGVEESLVGQDVLALTRFGGYMWCPLLGMPRAQPGPVGLTMRNVTVNPRHAVSSREGDSSVCRPTQAWTARGGQGKGATARRAGENQHPHTSTWASPSTSVRQSS